MEMGGHIARMKNNRWTKRCTEWQPRRGKRSRRDDQLEDGKTILKAKQHSKWKQKHPRYNKADP